MKRVTKNQRLYEELKAQRLIINSIFIEFQEIMETTKNKKYEANKERLNKLIKCIL